MNDDQAAKWGRLTAHILGNGLLTDAEHEAMRLTSELANALSRIVAGPTRDHDLQELILPLHHIQARVLAQAAARAYPGRYRLLGKNLLDSTAEAAESAVVPERADEAERTVSDERAERSEGTVQRERADPRERTESSERAEPTASAEWSERAVNRESTEAAERADEPESTVFRERADER